MPTAVAVAPARTPVPAGIVRRPSVAPSNRPPLNTRNHQPDAVGSRARPRACAPHWLGMVAMVREVCGLPVCGGASVSLNEGGTTEPAATSPGRSPFFPFFLLSSFL